MAAYHEERRKKSARVIARAWHDEAYKKRLLTDPLAALKEEGVNMPAGSKVHFHESTHNDIHMVLPPRPKDVKTEELTSHSHMVPELTLISIC